MKKVLYLFIALLTSFIVMSCDNMSNNNNNNINKIPENCTVLKVLDYAPANDPFKEIWDQFQKENPDIYIIREVHYGDAFHQKTKSYAKHNQMPDVFMMSPKERFSPIIHENKLAKDLMPFIEKDGLKDNYIKACLNPKQQKSGYVAALPLGLGTTNCVYANTKILKECGLTPAKTYEELKAQLPILKDAGKELIIIAANHLWVTQQCLFSMICSRMGGELWADDILEGKAKFTDEPFKSALQMIKTMYTDGVLSQESRKYEYGEVTGLFASEKGAYLVDGDWRKGAFMTDPETGEALISPAKQASDIELIPFPALPGEKYPGANSGKIDIGYGMSSSIPDGSKKEEAAWRLIKWLSGPKMQQARLNPGDIFPSLIKGISFDKYEPLVAKGTNFYTQITAIAPPIDSIFDVAVTNIIEEKLWYLGEEETVDQACEEIQTAYDNYYKK